MSRTQALFSEAGEGVLHAAVPTTMSQARTLGSWRWDVRSLVWGDGLMHA